MRCLPPACRAFAALLFVASSTWAVAEESPASPPVKKEQVGDRYVCPPCGADCHHLTFEGPGRCPVCGMRLVPQGPVRKVAILVWDGVELLDFAGPAEVFAAARAFDAPAFQVYLVSPSKGQVTSQGFVTLQPNHTIDDCPRPDVLVVPGGGTNRLLSDKKALEWIRTTANNTDVTMSVCTGAFALAECGLLDGLEATTWYGAVDGLRSAAPKTRVHAGRRIVDNGDIITTAGVSAGIDGALLVVSRLIGADVARNTARYMEYAWLPEVPRGALQQVAERGLKKTRSLADDLMVQLETRLAARKMNAADVLHDAGWLAFHEDPRFRGLIRRYADRSSATMVTPDEPGEPLHVSGVVRDADDQPVAGALIYAFHTGNSGSYSSTGGNVADMGDSLNPRLFVYLRTDAEGRYEYRTIKPGQYPGSGPPAHVHYAVEAGGFEKLETELMFEGDSRMSDDAREELEGIGFVVAKLDRGEDGVLRCRCDLRLKRAAPGGETE